MVISGFVLFDSNAESSPSAPAYTGVWGIPVALQATASPCCSGALTAPGAVALTAADGSFVFENVPQGTYRVAKAFGCAGGGKNPVLWPACPPEITVAPAGFGPGQLPPGALPSGGTRIKSLTPDIIAVTAAADVTGLAFVCGPETEPAFLCTANPYNTQASPGGAICLGRAVSSGGAGIALCASGCAVALEKGAYLVNCRASAFPCGGCRHWGSRVLGIGLYADGAFQPGSGMREDACMGQMISLSGCVIVECPDEGAALSLRSCSDSAAVFCDICLTITRL